MKCINCSKCKSNIYVSFVTNISSCSHPEQLLRLSCGVPVKVWWVYWLYLNRDLIGQQFVETLSCIFCQVWFAVTQRYWCPREVLVRLYTCYQTKWENLSIWLNDYARKKKPCFSMFTWDIGEWAPPQLEGLQAVGPPAWWTDAAGDSPAACGRTLGRWGSAAHAGWPSLSVHKNCDHLLCVPPGRGQES